MEQKESKNTRIGVFMEKSLLERCDSAVPKTNAQSRSEFICDAIDFYVAWLNVETNSKVLTPALESVIGAKIQDTENRIARVMFKQGVELAMLMHVIASTNEVDTNALNDLRKLCVDEVSRISGRYSFDDAVKFQKS